MSRVVIRSNFSFALLVGGSLLRGALRRVLSFKEFSDLLLNKQLGSLQLSDTLILA